MKKSTWLMSLFSSVSKRSGETYFSAVHKGSDPIVIRPGDRVTLVKSSKTASNGSEIWSLLKDDPGVPDEDRVYERSADTFHRDIRPDAATEAARARGWSRAEDDAIPF